MNLETVEEVIEELDKRDDGKIAQTRENCIKCITLDSFLKGAFRYNMLSGQTDVVRNLGWKRDDVRAITNIDIYQIRRYIEKNYGLMCEKKIDEAVHIVASENRYHPIIEHLESLSWDGVERISKAMPIYLGVEENSYNTEIMEILLKAGLKRIYNPGCKFEIMVCLVGSQGVGKSTFFRFLALDDDWFTDDLKKLDEKQVGQRIAGHWIIEMSEMLATVNAKSIEEIKSFLSRQRDNFRLPYDKYFQEHLRQCVFVGTSNNADFLPLDRTGNRRFAPVQTNENAVVKHILSNEEEARAFFTQLWAEAIAKFGDCKDAKLKFSKETEDYLRKAQKDFMPEDTKAGLIQGFLDRPSTPDRVCTEMIFREALSRDMREAKQYEIKEINNIMNTSIVGWKKGPVSRFSEYGTQRSWIRVSEFIPVPDDEELPFK